jgi:MFS family permease
VSPDVRRIVAAQAVRALGYGFASVLLGATLTSRGYSSTRAGLLLAAVVAGAVTASLAVGTFGERLGRRRSYAVLFAALAVAGVAFALTDQFWILLPVALTGALSTEVVESGPFTSLEQAMLAQSLSGKARTRAFGIYNAVATIAGSAGALAAGGPALARRLWHGVPADERFFLVLAPIGAWGLLLAMRLSATVEVPEEDSGARRRAPLERSRPAVVRLAGLFGADAFAGGFVVQSFVAYWLRVRFGASVQTLALVFSGIGLLQAGSFMLAVRLAGRFGLLNTMVFTHLPSNLLLASIGFAPNLPVAIALLYGRHALGQMDVPTRQAYVMALVDPEERTAAAAYTNTARYVARPVGPVLAGASQQVALGLPFVIAGGVKAIYDVVLYRWFRRVPIEPDS